MTGEFTFDATSEFDKSLALLDVSIQRRIIRLLPDIIKNPGIGKRLKGKPVLWSARLGDYRVIYSVDFEQVHGTFHYAGHRKKVYAKLKRAC